MKINFTIFKYIKYIIILNFNLKIIFKLKIKKWFYVIYSIH